MAAEGVAQRAEARAGAEPGVLVAGIGPRDGIEETLAAHMAACHEAALSCLANARRRDLPESARAGELGLVGTGLTGPARIVRTGRRTLPLGFWAGPLDEVAHGANPSI